MNAVIFNKMLLLKIEKKESNSLAMDLNIGKTVLPLLSFIGLIMMVPGFFSLEYGDNLLENNYWSSTLKATDNDW